MKTQFNALAVGLLIVLVAALSGCGGTEKDIAFDKAFTGMEMSEQLVGSFGDFSKILGSVTDAASAEKALPQLNSMDADLESLANAASESTADTKSSLSDIAANHIPGLSAITDRVYAIPGVQSVLKPSVDGLLAKFASFM